MVNHGVPCKRAAKRLSDSDQKVHLDKEDEAEGLKAPTLKKKV